MAAHLRSGFPGGNFLPGTLVASCQGPLPEVGDRAPLDVPSPQGLEVVLDVHGRPRHSLRGIIVHRRHLDAPDEAGDAVKIFKTKSGRLVARIKGKKLARPVHLILHADALYIGAAGTGSILAYDIPKRAPRGTLKARSHRRQAQSPVRLCDRAGRRSLRGRTVRPAGPALFHQGEEEGDVHQRAPGRAGVPGARAGSGVELRGIVGLGAAEVALRCDDRRRPRLFRSAIHDAARGSGQADRTVNSAGFTRFAA